MPEIADVVLSVNALENLTTDKRQKAVMNKKSSFP